jgi:hypothetical protein
MERLTLTLMKFLFSHRKEAKSQRIVYQQFYYSRLRVLAVKTAPANALAI